ncbi:hypothetical protein SUGI_0215950 [Cryptomeria japonica]|nr:hypothetical protein SUGI_0215950 [Cryptomeria japonica]
MKKSLQRVSYRSGSPANKSTSHPAQENEENEESESPESSNSQIIPGLPDDIAYEGLLRTPLQSHHTMSVRAFDVNSKTWISLPPVPENRHRHAVGQEIAVVDSKIVICGGWRENPLDPVSIFDPVSYSWFSGPPMLSPRAHFVSGVIGDKLYIAGGGDGKQPRSAEAEFFDPVENKWFPVASLETGISFCLGVSMAGKLFVQARGGVSRETMVFLPDFGMWSALRSNMLAWPHRPHAVVNDELLYRSDFKDGKHELMVYDGQIDGWKSVGIIDNGPNRRICEIVGVGGEVWGIAEDFSVGSLKLENLPSWHVCTEDGIGAYVPWGRVLRPGIPEQFLTADLTIFGGVFASVSTIRSLSERWNIRSSTTWNLTDPCSGQASSTAKIGNPGIKCACSGTVCHVTQISYEFVKDNLLSRADLKEWKGELGVMDKKGSRRIAEGYWWGDLGVLKKRVDKFNCFLNWLIQVPLLVVMQWRSSLFLQLHDGEHNTERVKPLMP